MELGLYGKSVFVAAGSKGLGKASALEFAREGALVTIASRSMEHLTKAAKEIEAATGQQVHTVRMDVSDPEQIEQGTRSALDKYGRLDVLVTNAGGPPAGTFADMDDAQWQSAFEKNLLSTIRLIRAAIPSLQAAGGGRIVNIASSSVKQPIDGLILSNIFRAGIQALTKSLASEYAADHILINTVAPGRIATERIMELDQKRADMEQRAIEEIQTESLRQIPLGRLGTPEEFGRMVAFYGSFANTYVTGQSLLVDGGTIRAY
ncbi:SDR family oxidoreductase [Paenibacillus bovis]|uniref:3-oxoacyl-ACP reductase n=1 Tax=Paenibacillus bovis TaxID=1616788 RepID=A0A172ZCA4_9BACL|nr:SDR family oxidoreductase [Paenibacillus bovis]ANF95276.1 3-oxoacyl-ACP reductase [Paenibacillus bovis]